MRRLRRGQYGKESREDRRAPKSFGLVRALGSGLHLPQSLEFEIQRSDLSRSNQRGLEQYRPRQFMDCDHRHDEGLNGQSPL